MTAQAFRHITTPVGFPKLQAEAAWLGSRRAEAHARDTTARITRALVDVAATTRTFRAS